MLYASTVWSGTYDSDILKLERIHVDGMRLITGATARSNIANLYTDTGFSNIRSICDNAMLIMMYKMKNNTCPTYLQNLLPPTVEEVSSYNLRDKHNVVLPYARLDCLQRSFITKSIALWNQIPLPVRNSTSLETFKKHIKGNSEKNLVYYYGERRPSIHHARMRIGCSELKDDFHENLHVIASSSCDCGAAIEDANHFFTICPRYINERHVLRNTIASFTTFKIQTILFGDKSLDLNTNKLIFGAVHKYIIDTERFS